MAFYSDSQFESGQLGSSSCANLWLVFRRRSTGHALALVSLLPVVLYPTFESKRLRH
ncbi:hypothetical protein HMPREF1981_01142 [Bacteroides pyogenes F0041]|uniref:Uncharacterized protein n=1 Tax=Bacteroides pyogenes F0041 TaxID=1321819 RepID=U2C625_9BACE|nr:hypothetical protein HMPREF1981_01142 [Bacteroides pyogenes F0041]